MIIVWSTGGKGMPFNCKGSSSGGSELINNPMSALPSCSTILGYPALSKVLTIECFVCGKYDNSCQLQLAFSAVNKYLNVMWDCDTSEDLNTISRTYNELAR